MMIYEIKFRTIETISKKENWFYKMFLRQNTVVEFEVISCRMNQEEAEQHVIDHFSGNYNYGDIVIQTKVEIDSVRVYKGDK